MSTLDAYVFPSQVPVNEQLRTYCLEARGLKVLLDIASDTIGIDFRATLKRADPVELSDGRFRRPLIGCISLLAYQQHAARHGQAPVCVTGMSLGCLTAATAVGWIGVEDFVRISHLMASIEADAFGETDYVSVFFLAGNHTRVFEELRAESLDGLLHISAYVSTNQFLAAARRSDLDRMRTTIARTGAVFQAIEHSFPGHCDLMGNVQKEFEKSWVITGGARSLSTPLININTGRPCTDAEDVRRLVIEQYTTVMDWGRVLQYIQSLGVDRCFIVEPAGFVSKSMELDPACNLVPESIPLPS